MNAKQLGAAAAATAACAMAVAGAAWACGDKLVALGGGVGFERVMVSRNPGHIVLVLEPSTGLAAANERYDLDGSLKLAGHEVFIVTNADDLRAERNGVAPDLILVDVTRASQLQFRPVTNSGPMIMPVAYSADGAEPRVSDQQAACVTVASGRKGSQLLKAVEQAMKLRSRGLSLPCEKSPDSQQA